MQKIMNQRLLTAVGVSTAAICLAAATCPAQAAVFEMLTTEGLNSTTTPTGLDVTFEQRWREPTIWNLVSGVDDGGDGIPNGLDEIIVDRTALANGNTDLSNEGMPDHSIAKLTGVGAPGTDIVFKQSANVTIGDMEILASADRFFINEERDQPLTINGVLSGSGDLEINRNGGFSNGVQRVDPVTGEEELILFTGAAPNTYTGNLFLTNGSGSQPAYFVADKVGAFGQAATVNLRSTNAGSLEAELQLTDNTIGGEGAFDDDATEVYLGSKAVLNVDAGVNEIIGSGKLFIDLLNTGTFTMVPDGLYTNAEDWIIGDGTITVGGSLFDPADLDQDGDVDDADFGIAFAAFTGPGGVSNSPADLDGDGDVDDADFGIAFAAFTGPGGGPGVVPEPTSLALLGLGGLMIARRRRA